MRKFKCIFLVILLLGLTACGRAVPETGHTQSNPAENTAQLQKPSESTQKENTTDNEEPDIIGDLLGSMTLEEKVGQLFIAAFRYTQDNQPMLELDEATKRQIEKFKPGGVILFGQNIRSIQQTTKLIDDLQLSSKTSLFIAVDEEGGKISRLNSSPLMHATRLPGNAVLGRTKDPELAYRVGALLGQELASLGFNMDFAPVADINSNPLNPVIGIRSFGSDPDGVGEMVEAMVKGIQDQNIIAVLKHFPGHGDTSSDTHTGSVIINHDLKRLQSMEFIPFEKGILAGADGVMTAHIQAPQITGDSLPATLSSKFLTEILRNELKHDKLIITDALEMGAISNYWGSGEAAVKAFQAGSDIMLIPASLEEACDAVIKAVKEGVIGEDRLNESVRRILSVKNNRGILNGGRKDLDPEKTLGSKEHLDIAEEILRKGSKN